MKKISDLYKINKDIFINDIKTNSKEVRKNDLFCAISGVNCDRHLYIDEAINNGASFLVVSKTGKYNVPYLKVKNTNKEINSLAKYFYEYDNMQTLIGITGTDGKTTTASIIKDMLGNSCGYIGTNGIAGSDIKYESPNTTPDICTLCKCLQMFKDNNINTVAMEVSSEGLYRKRVEGLEFFIGILTNITEDHLNIHKSIKEYVKCKRKLFKMIKPEGVAILNMDDKYYKSFRRVCCCKVLTYGKNKYSTLIINSVTEKEEYTLIDYIYENHNYYIKTNLKGEFNAYNLAAAILALSYLGYSMNDIIERISNIKIPMGRCEFLNYNTNFNIVIDYAHTPNSIKNILNYLNKIKKNRIITITGSAGGREKEKRKDIGMIVQEMSGIVIYTMDDPRYENVLDIIGDLIDKKKDNYLIIENRELAIKKALELAKDNDIVAILGKGRDNYMAIEDKYLVYSDINVLEKYLK